MTAIGIITFIVALASLGLSAWLYYWKRRRLKVLEWDVKRLTRVREQYAKTLIESGCSWRYGENEDEHYFDIYGLTYSGVKAVKRFSYDPSDPDDREYMRIEAQELVEHLNYKP